MLYFYLFFFMMMSFSSVKCAFIIKTSFWYMSIYDRKMNSIIIIIGGGGGGGGGLHYEQHKIHRLITYMKK